MGLTKGLTKRVGIVASAASLSLAGVTSGGTPNQTDDDLNQRIAELEARVAELQGQTGDTWLSEQRATEIRALVQDVLADADTRSSLLQGGAMAGHDGGNFYIGSPEGDFLLKVGGMVQVRYMFNNVDEDDAGIVDGSRGGFELPRTRIMFAGHIFDPALQYHVEGDFGFVEAAEFGGARDDGDFELLDAWIAWHYGNGWSIYAGQQQLPLLREELVDAAFQQTVERSLINSAFSADRSQGIWANYGDPDSAWQIWLAYSDGARQANSPALGYDTEYALTGRAEFLLGGEWDQFEDFASWQEEDFGALVGIAAHYERDEYGTMATEFETTVLTADISLEFGGANLFGAVIYADNDAVDDGDLIDDDDINPWAAIVQGGVFLSEDWELFGRFEWGDSDIAGDDDLAILTVGATNYIHSHHMKWTTDFGYAFNEISPFWGASTDSRLAGWRSSAEDDGQWVIRSQFQLLF